MASGVSIPHVYQHMGVSLALWILVILAVLIDLWDGVYTARTLKQRIHSHKLRVTIRKIGEYWRFILMGFVADTIGILFPFWAWPYLSMLICLAVIGIEFKSVMEHAERRKSKSADIPKVIEAIVKCASKKEAEDIYNALRKIIDDNSQKSEPIDA